MYKKKLKTSREIGEKIKGRRRELGISQESLAEILGVTYQQVQRYENGTNKLNVENIHAVADALNVPASYFFEAEKTSMIAEKPAFYLSANENRLLRYFRKIKSSASKKNSHSGRPPRSKGGLTQISPKKPSLLPRQPVTSPLR